MQMIGTFRFLLACLVILRHLSPATAPYAGSIAVYCFYVISGFLITKTICHHYDQTPGGIGRFLANRLTRLYPTYFAALALACLIIAAFPDKAASLNPALALPRTPSDIAANIFIVGLLDKGVRPIPPAWSLDIELTAYALMALGLSSRPRWTLAWFLASLAYSVWLWNFGSFDLAYNCGFRFIRPGIPI